MGLKKLQRKQAATIYGRSSWSVADPAKKLSCSCGSMVVFLFSPGYLRTFVPPLLFLLSKNEPLSSRDAADFHRVAGLLFLYQNRAKSSSGLRKIKPGPIKLTGEALVKKGIEKEHIHG